MKVRRLNPAVVPVGAGAIGHVVVPLGRPVSRKPVQVPVEPQVAVEPGGVDVAAAVGQPHVAAVGVPQHGGVDARGNRVRGHGLGEGLGAQQGPAPVGPRQTRVLPSGPAIGAMSIGAREFNRTARERG